MGREAPFEIRQIDLGPRRIDFRLKRSRRRRTVNLMVHPEQGLVVYSPHRYAKWRLEEVLRRHAKWILKKLDKAEQTRGLLPQVEWQAGAPFPFLGHCYPLQVTRDGRRRELRLAVEGLRLHLPRRITPPQGGPELRRELLLAYRRAAREIIEAKLRRLEGLVGVSARAIRVKDQKRRWGSCSPKGILNFNWRLVLAPPPVMEYVIVHELCHLIHLDHSPRFWRRVGAVLPNYREPQAWLRSHGPALFAY